MSRGYFGIGVYHPKTVTNIGTMWRSAFNFGAAFIFVIGRRYKFQPSDTLDTPKHIPLYDYETFEDFRKNRPRDNFLIGVEQSEQSIDLKTFEHPERGIYILGAEDNGLPNEILDRCNKVISIDSPRCLNVAVAGSIVMFDRHNKK